MKKPAAHYFVFAAALVTVLAAWWYTPALVNWLLPPKPDTTRLVMAGQFGDSFNAINALFAMLAFLFLAATWWETRRANRHAAFADRSLRVVEACQTRRESVRYFLPVDKEYVVGEEALYLILSELSKWRPDGARGTKPWPGSTIQERLCSKANAYHETNGSRTYASYTRFLALCLRLLDESDADQSERSFAVGLFTAQLSETDLKLLFYYLYTTEGRDFFDLVVKYKLLDSLRLEAMSEGDRDVLAGFKKDPSTVRPSGPN